MLSLCFQSSVIQICRLAKKQMESLASGCSSVGTLDTSSTLSVNTGGAAEKAPDRPRDPATRGAAAVSGEPKMPKWLKLGKNKMMPDGLVSALGHNKMMPDGVVSALGNNKMVAEGLVSALGKNKMMPEGLVSALGKSKMMPKGLVSALGKNKVMPDGKFFSI